MRKYYLQEVTKEGTSKREELTKTLLVSPMVTTLKDRNKVIL